MNILQVNITFNDVVNIIHDVIITPNTYPYNAKFLSVGVRIKVPIAAN